MSKENPTLGEALFSAMLNASLIAVQGPNMVQDAAAMKAVGDSIVTLDKTLNKWFAEQAGFQMSEAERAAFKAIAPVRQPVKAAPVEETTTPSGIVVVNTPKRNLTPTVGRDGQPTQEIRDGRLYWIKSGKEVSAEPVSTGAAGNDTSRSIAAPANPFDPKPVRKVKGDGNAALEGEQAELARQMAEIQAAMQGH